MNGSQVQKVDPLSTIRNNKLNTQGEKLETAKLRVFVSNISSLPSVKSAIYEIQLFVSRISAPLGTQRKVFIMFCMHVQCGISIKNHQNNLMFSYYKLGCRSFELNLFSHCFNLKELNLNKHIERLRKDLLFALQLTDLTKCPKCMLFTLQDSKRTRRERELHGS